jgi:hypothetical protein
VELFFNSFYTPSRHGQERPLPSSPLLILVTFQTSFKCLEIARNLQQIRLLIYEKSVAGPPEHVEGKVMRMNTSFTATNGQNEILQRAAAAKQ